MRGETRLVIAAIIPALVLVAAATLASVSNAQVNVDAAKSTFQKLGCTSCHMKGGSAKSFDDIISDILKWRTQYGSIDEAVRSQVKYYGGQTFNSYDEMMKLMAENVGKTLNDPNMQMLYNFFLEVFKSGLPTQTPAQAPTQTGTAQPGTAAPAEAAGPSVGLVALLGVAVAAALVGVSYALSRR